jgi:hypothetical protein
MGEPFFKIKDFCERKNVHSFSSNYSLYGDLSKRVMEILIAESEESEIYSIDEAFLTFSSGLSSLDVFTHCLQLRQKVKQWVGIPISLGIAPTKTLAKVANQHAKKKTTCGVFDLTDLKLQKELLKQLPVEEIWGIGKKFAERLHGKNIFCSFDLSCLPLVTIKQWMGVLGERIVLELQGISCLDLEELKHIPNLSLEDVIDNNIKNKDAIGKYKGQDLFIKNGKFGIYAEWGKESKSLKGEFSSIPIDKIEYIDVIRFLDKDNILDPTKPVGLVRELNNHLSIRTGKYGDYIFYKKPRSKKPEFIKLNGFNDDYKKCDKVLLLNWIKQTHNIE